MEQFILRHRKGLGEYRVSKRVGKKEVIVAYFVEYTDAMTFIFHSGECVENHISGEGISDEPKTISFEDLMIKLKSGEPIECEVNKEVFEQVNRFRGQTYIGDDSKIQVLNLEGITLKPKIKNIYLKPGSQLRGIEHSTAILDDLPV